MKAYCTLALLCSALCITTPMLAPRSGLQRPVGAPPRKPIVVRIEHTKNGLFYEVDSRKSADLLLSLSQLRQQRGASCPVIALLDPQVPVNWIDGIDGIAAKAELTNVRVFVVNHETKKMAEILELPAIPYSTNPPKR